MKTGRSIVAGIRASTSRAFEAYKRTDFGSEPRLGTGRERQIVERGTEERQENAAVFPAPPQPLVHYYTYTFVSLRFMRLD